MFGGNLLTLAWSVPLPPPNPNNLLPTSKQRLSLNCWRKGNSDGGRCVCVCARVATICGSLSGHHLFHSSLPLASLALCRCCWAELWFEGLGSPSKLQIYFQRSRWALCLWTKKGVSSRSPVTEPLFSCIPAGHLLDRGGGAGAGRVWLPTLPTPSMAKRGLRILSLAHWWNW